MVCSLLVSNENGRKEGGKWLLFSGGIPYTYVGIMQLFFSPVKHESKVSEGEKNALKDQQENIY